MFISAHHVVCCYEEVLLRYFTHVVELFAVLDSFDIGLNGLISVFFANVCFCECCYCVKFVCVCEAL